MCNVRTPLDVVVLMLSCIRVKCFMEATQEITVIELFVTRQKLSKKHTQRISVN